MGEKGDVLDRVTYTFAQFTRPVVVDGFAESLNGPGVRSQQADDQLNKGRFAAATFAEYRGDPATRQRQRDVAQRVDAAAAQRDAVEPGCRALRLQADFIHRPQAYTVLP